MRPRWPSCAAQHARDYERHPAADLVAMLPDNREQAKRVLAYFRAQGSGWQTRINATLRRAARRKP
jgi:uncharacterized protein (DUF4415 family)